MDDPDIPEEDPEVESAGWRPSVFIALAVGALVWMTLRGFGSWALARGIGGQPYILNVYASPPMGALQGAISGLSSFAAAASIPLLLVSAGRRRIFWVPTVLAFAAPHITYVARVALDEPGYGLSWGFIGPALLGFAGNVLLLGGLVLVPAVLLARRRSGRHDPLDRAAWVAICACCLLAPLIPVMRILLWPGNTYMWPWGAVGFLQTYAPLVIFGAGMAMTRPWWPWAPGVPGSIGIAFGGLLVLLSRWIYVFPKGPSAVTGFVNLFSPSRGFWSRLTIWTLPEMLMVYVASMWPLVLRLRGPLGRAYEASRKAMSYSSTFEDAYEDEEDEAQV